MNAPRVSRISIGRLVNLGSYEHIRYEVTVEIPEGADATKTLATVEKALNTMAEPHPGKHSYPSLSYARAVLAKPKGELTPQEVESMPAYQRLVDAYAAWEKRQEYARAVLGDFSLSSEYTDHKEKVEVGRRSVKNPVSVTSEAAIDAALSRPSTSRKV